MTGAARWPSGYSQDVDWSLLGCARKGHVTYAPDEPELRNRLMAAGLLLRMMKPGPRSLLLRDRLP